jgi:tetratricopeptide (TPR) repeat protein/tRNA A-37 threonylcarbamoyl transferase component Bud32
MQASHSKVAERETRLGEMLAALLEAAESGSPLVRDDWLARHPEFAAELNEFFASEDHLRNFTAPLRDVVAVDTPIPGTTWPDDGTPQWAGQSFGDYELLGEIGRGGMGVVFKARQKGANRIVALKVLRTDPLGGKEQARRFRNEAEIVAGLDHPNIVPLYEVGEDAGHVWFSMKLIEGGSLDERLERFAADPRGAAGVVAAVARAVHHAHQRGVLHRDLKPSNILLGEDGRPYVSDFGLARRLEADGGLTQSGALVGTPSYMAPEQAAGQRSAITTATDVYGLGAVLYTLLAGRPPFQADAVVEMLVQVRQSEPEPPGKRNPKVDRDLETVCLKCLHKDPARRYQGAGDLAEDLECWLRDEPIQARRPGVAQRIVKWTRRHRHLVAAGVLSLVLAVPILAGSLFVVWWKHADTKEALRKAQLIQREVEFHSRDRVKFRNESEENLEKSLKVMDRLLSALDEAPPGQEAEFALARRAISGRALEIYQDLLPIDSDRASLKWEMMWAYIRVGNLHTHRNEFAQAEEAYRMAYRTAARLGKQSLWIIGAGERVPPEVLFAGEFQDRPEAEKAFRKALAHWRRAAPQGLGAVADYRAALAESAERHFRHMIGRDLARMVSSPPGRGHTPRAGRTEADPERITRQGVDQVFRGRIRVLQRVLADLPTPGNRRTVVDLYFAHAQYSRRCGRVDDAEVAFRSALECAAKWREDHPADQGEITLLDDVWPLVTRLRHVGTAEETERAHRAFLSLRDRLAHQKDKTHEAYPIETGWRHLYDAVRRKGPHDAASALREKKLLAQVIAEHAQLLRAHGDSPGIHFALAGLLCEQGELEDSIAEYRTVLCRLQGRIDSFPRTYHQLGKVLEKAGRVEEALDVYRAALRYFQKRMEERGWVAHRPCRYRCDAASVAALAGCVDRPVIAGFDAKARARLRAKALDYLRAEMRAWQRLLEEGGNAGPIAAQAMQHWLADADFKGVRDAEALGRLPAQERVAWAKLWAGVTDLLARAKPSRPANKEKVPRP